MPANPRFTLVRSKLVGPAAHHEQLLQLLNAPVDYWKAQTPIPGKPTGKIGLAGEGASFSEFQVVDGVTLGQMETLLVLMAARMPQISVTFDVSGAGEVMGLRLLLGKLEAGRAGGSETIDWQPLPHHSTLIGSK